jgi:hypothetical protein
VTETPVLDKATEAVVRALAAMVEDGTHTMVRALRIAYLWGQLDGKTERD